MDKRTLFFDTSPVATELGGEGYRLYMQSLQPKKDDAVYEELGGKLTKDITPAMMQFIVEKSIDETKNLVAADGIPRIIGGLKFTPVMRGTVSGPYSAYDSTTCTAVVAVVPLPGMDRKMDMDRVCFVNRRNQALKVSIIRVATVGADASGVIAKGKPFMVIGTNLQYIAGDSVEISYVEEGETLSVALTPTESDVSHMLFAWPAALAEVEPGTELTITFRTRGGVEESDIQTNEVKVKLVAAA